MAIDLIIKVLALVVSVVGGFFLFYNLMNARIISIISEVVKVDTKTNINSHEIELLRQTNNDNAKEDKEYAVELRANTTQLKSLQSSFDKLEEKLELYLSKQ